tara:strand:- start:3946 stop:5856 length:1911 start_codon:yes stop_codon:yes gene_type:complete
MIELPEKFKKDTEGKETFLVPLVVIDNQIYISTNKLNLENSYQPLLKDIGNIRESIDIKEKRFKTSSITMQCYNYDYNNTTLSVRLFSPSVLNKKLEIYYKSQSAESLDDCLKVYSGYIKDVEENIDSLRITVEDRTEVSLKNELPIRKTSFSEDLPEDRRDRPIPMVYGVVDRCPLIYRDATILGSDANFGLNKNYNTIADDFFIRQCVKPKIFVNNGYPNISKELSLFEVSKPNSIYQGLTQNQYDDQTDDNSIIFESQVDIEEIDFDSGGFNNGSPISYNMVEVNLGSRVSFESGKYTLEWDFNDSYDKPEGDADSSKKSVPILPYEDTDGVTESNKVYDSYLQPSNYALFPEIIQNSPNHIWSWGKNKNYFEFDNGYVFNELRGVSLVLFKILENFPSESDTVKALTNVNEDNDDVEIKARVSVDYAVEAEITQGAYQTNIDASPDWERPQLNLNYGRTTLKEIKFGVINDGDTYNSIDNDGDGYEDIIEHHKGDLSGSVGNYDWYYVDNPSEKSLEMSNRWFDFGSETGSSVLDRHGKAMSWLKIKHLKVYKQAIVEDFDKRDLYAEVEGRVDDTLGRYTGESFIVLSGQSDADFTQTSEDRAVKAVSSRKKLSSNTRFKKKQQITKSGKY